MKPAVAMLLLCASSAVTAQTLSVPVPEVSDPLLDGLVIPADAAENGMWSSVMSWPLVSIHVVLLPDGTVLSFGSPLGLAEQRGEVFDRWDPLTLSHETTPNAVGVNSFCSASILQQSGDLLVSGGNSPFSSSLFDYEDDSASGEPSNLSSERWYATLTMLPDGRSLITGGEIPYFTETWTNPEANLGNVSMTPEIYTPGSGWSSLFGANSRDAFGPDHNRWWYPRQWVAPNGLVFGVSSEKMWYLDPQGVGDIDIVGDFKTGVNSSTRPNVGPTSTAVMFDVGKVIQVGGNGYHNGQPTTSSERATVIDLNGGDPVLTEAAPMQHRRQWANSLVLPTGDVLVTGGTRFADSGGSNAVYQAELWDPDADAWDGLASAAVIRNYHSTTILLPNGAVFSSGGGVPGPVDNLNAEIFYPPYLFEDSGAGPDLLADRPRLVSLSTLELPYDSSFQVEMADSRSIDHVALIGLSSTTHSFNNGQRRYPAAFSQDDSVLTVSTPPGANIAPPGYYLLFVVDDADVPSRGLIVAIDADAPGCSVDSDCDDGSLCTDDACNAGICQSLDNGQCSTDPLAVYTFDEGAGTVAHDSSGNGFDAALMNGAGWATGQQGSALDLDGGSELVDLPNGLVEPCDDFTFAAWVRLDANDTWARIFDFGNDTSRNMFLTPAAGNPNTMRFALKIPGINAGLEEQITYPYTFPLGVWTHVAVTLSGVTGRLYVDGAEVESAIVIGDPSAMGATVNNRFGDSQYTSDPALDGRLDDVRISCRAFSASEIAALADPSTACGDATCNGAEDCETCPADCGPCPVYLIDADFQAGTDGFTFVDDAFFQTSQPDYASGAVVGNALQVLLGGVDEADIEDMSGGWAAAFDLSAPAEVDVELTYSIEMPAAYEADECSRVLVAIDGALYGDGAEDHVVELCAGAAAGGTFAFSTPSLAAGSHTITIGGFSSKKTTSDEQTAILFDDVRVGTQPGPPGEPVEVNVTAYAAETLTVEYEPACGATDHDVYYAALPPATEIEWAGQVCDLGLSGSLVLADPLPGSSWMFVVVGNRDGAEGTYGTGSDASERPAFAGAACEARTRDLSPSCD